MDNYHSAPELFVMLKPQYKILACEMICKNRKGWEQSHMILSTMSKRGTSKINCDKINGILFGQWKDNEVVFFISKLSLVGNGFTTCQ